jgi:hypothetical protein
MSKTSVEAVNAKEATKKWRRPKTADFQQQDRICCHPRKGSARGSPCCHFGKIKFIKYIAIAIFYI